MTGGDKVIKLTVDVQAQLSSLERSLKKMQSEFSQLKGPTNITANMKADMDALLDRIKKVQQYTENNQIKIIDGQKATTELERIKSAYQSLLKRLNINQEKLSLNINSKEFGAIESAMQKYENTIRAANEDIAEQEKLIDQINDKINKATQAQNTKATVYQNELKQLQELQKATEQLRQEKQRYIEDAKGKGRTDAQAEAYWNRTKKAKELTQAEADLATQEQRTASAEKSLATQTTKTNTIIAEGQVELTQAKAKLEEYQKALSQIDTTAFQQLKDDLIAAQAEGAKFNFDPSALQNVDQLRQHLQELLNSDDSKIQAIMQNLITGFRAGAQGAENLGTAIGTSVDAGKDLNNQMEQFKHRINYFFSAMNAVNLFKRAIRSAFETVKDLDKVMTETAVVTEFSVGDMWSQLPEYTQRANELGVSIHSAYEAATLYYQQGLETNQVVEVSNETLKMARIAGLGAADATDRMTNALRGFNMEINEANAQNINDVYSKLAAITASNVDEISTAMTKVASLANNANMSFENTSAFLAQIIETTRESAETAGTALKTVIARFSEVKKLVDKGLLTGKDGEDEVIDVNKVSQALRTAGINLNEYLTGMKGLDDIFIELASKWDSLDNVQQRYIATMAAGSRQQSRFIALMSDYARTTELVSAANNASGASQEQFNKTLDSLESKLNQLKNSWDSFLMSIADNSVIKTVVDMLKGFLDFINKITDGLPGMFSGFAKIALVIGGAKLVKPLLQKMLASVSSMFIQKATDTAGQSGTAAANSFLDRFKIAWDNRGKEGGFLNSLFSEETEKLKKSLSKSKLKFDVDDTAFINNVNKCIVTTKTLGVTITGIGTAFLGISSILSSIGVDEEVTKWISSIGMVAMAAGSLLTTLSHIPVVMGVITKAAAVMGLTINAAWGVIGLIVTAVGVTIAAIVTAINNIETAEERLERVTKELQDAVNELQKANEAVNEIASNQSAYEDLINQVRTLTKGTKEWREALYRVNQETLKMLALHEELAPYITIDDNGMLSISDQGFQFLQNRAQQEIAIAQNRVAGSQLRVADATNSVTTKQYKQTMLDQTLPILSGKMNVESLQKYTDALAKLEAQNFTAAATSLTKFAGQKEYALIANALASTSFVENEAKRNSQAVSKNMNGHDWWLNVLGPVLGGTLGGVISGTINAHNVISQDKHTKNLKKEFEQMYGQSYEEFAEAKEIAQKNWDKDVRERVADAKSAQKFEKAYEDLLHTGLFSTLDVVFNEEILEGFDDELKEAVKKQEEINTETRKQIDKQYQDWFNKNAADVLQSYDDALSSMNVISFLTSGTGGQGVLQALQGVSGSKDFGGLLETLVDVDFSSAINGATDFAYILENGTKVEQQFVKELLEINGHMYNMTAQVNELWKSLDEDTLKELLKDGKIADSELRELAADNIRLKQVLDNTGVSTNTLATYYTYLAEGVLDASSSVTDFVAVLNTAMKAQNVLADTFNLIDTWQPGRSVTEAYDFFDDVKTKFLELKEMGNYSDTAIIDYERLILGETRFNELLKEAHGDMTVLANEAELLLNAMGTNFYGLWKAYSNGIENDAFAMNEDGSVGIDVTKIQSVDDVIQSLMNHLGISKDMAEAMFSDLMISSDKFRTAMDRVTATNAIQEWIKNGRVFGDIIEYDASELEVLAQQLGIEFEDLSKQVVESLQNTGKEVHIGKMMNADGALDQDSPIFNDLRENLKNQILNGTEEGLDQAIDLASTYHFLIDMGMNDEKARETISNLFTASQEDFEGMQFAFDPDTLQVAAVNEENLAKYGKAVTSQELADGIVEGTGDPAANAAQKLSALEYGEQLSTAVADGIIAGVTAPLKMITEGVKDIFLKLLSWMPDDWLGGLKGNIRNFDIAGDINKMLSKYARSNVTTQNEDERKRLEDIIAKSQKNVVTVHDIVTPDDMQSSLATLTNWLSNENKDFQSAIAYNTEAAQKIGDEVEDAGNDVGKKIEDAEHNLVTSLGLSGPLDELYNINQRIEASLRERNKLEREYDVLIHDQNTTLDQMRSNYFKQIDNLQNRAQEEATRKETASALLDAIKNRRYFVDENNFKTFEELGVADLVKFDGEKIIQDVRAINAISDVNVRNAFDEYFAMFEGYVDEFLSAEDNLVEIQQEIEDFQREAIDSYLSFEDRVMDSYIRNREMELDKLDAMRQAVADASNEIIKKIQQQINDARQARQNQKTEQDINNKEARLAYLRRDTSGANDLEIAQLEKELGENRQDYSDTLIDQAIEKMQADADLAAQQRQQQIDTLRQIHTDMVAAGEYWPEVYSLIANAFTDGTLNYNSDLVQMLMHTEGYSALSNVGQQRWWEDTTTAATKAYAVLSETILQPGIQGINSYTDRTVATSEQALRDTAKTLVNEAEEKVDNMRQEIRDGVLLAEEAAKNAADAALQAAIAAEEAAAAAKQSAESTDDAIEALGDYIKDKTNDNRQDQAIDLLADRVEQFDKDSQDRDRQIASLIPNPAADPANNPNAQNKIKNLNSGGYSAIATDDLLSVYGKTGSVPNYIGMKVTTDPFLTGQSNINNKQYNNIASLFAKAKTVADVDNIKAQYISNWNPELEALYQKWRQERSLAGRVYASGGLADYTGPAWLDGTRTHPEAVLSAEDTRNFISLRNILASLMSENGFNSINNTGEAYYDIDINAEIGSDYDVDQLAARVKKQITDNASYRNVTQTNLVR